MNFSILTKALQLFTLNFQTSSSFQQKLCERTTKYENLNIGFYLTFYIICLTYIYIYIYNQIMFLLENVNRALLRYTQHIYQLWKKQHRYMWTDKKKDKEELGKKTIYEDYDESLARCFQNICWVGIYICYTITVNSILKNIFILEIKPLVWYLCSYCPSFCDHMF